MKKFIIKNVFHSVNIINKLFFKLNSRISFIGFPDFDDQLRGILPYLNGDLVILVKNDKFSIPDWVFNESVANSLKIVKKNSLKGLYYFITSSVIFYTHGIYGNFSLLKKERQITINLWHGMPIKNIGLLDHKTEVPKFHYILSTSHFFSKILQDSFGVFEEQVLISGLPRNRILKNYTNNKKLLSLKKLNSKVVVWLPTYRKSKIGDIRNDGDSLNILGSNNFSLNSLNDFCIKNQILLIIKPHPMAIYDELNDTYSNIMKIDERWLLDNNTTLYEVLSISDSLITDFSSVAIDYEVSGKDVIYNLADIDDYGDNRGFTFNFKDSLVGKKVIYNQEDLTSILSEINVNNDINHDFCFDFSIIDMVLKERMFK